MQQAMRASTLSPTYTARSRSHSSTQPRCYPCNSRLSSAAANPSLPTALGPGGRSCRLSLHGRSGHSQRPGRWATTTPRPTSAASDTVTVTEQELAPPAQLPPPPPQQPPTTAAAVAATEKPAPPQADPNAASDAGLFPWTAHYYPLAVVSDLDPARPHSMQLLGLSLALWRDGAGQWHAVEDRCPHRLAPLSEGRIESDGSLQCAYHGWQFDGSGACTHIPQLRNDERAQQVACSSRRACVRAFPVQVVHGLLWVRPDSSEEAWAEATTNPVPASALPELLDGPRGEGWAQYGSWFVRDLPVRYDTLLENIVDPSHVPFSHHGLMGTRQSERGTSMRLLRSDPAGFEAEFNMSGMPSVVRFAAPALTWYNSRGIITAVYAVPTRPGWSRTIHGYAMDTRIQPRMPWLAYALRTAVSRIGWIDHNFFRNPIYDGDTYLLHAQERLLEGRGFDWHRGYFMPAPADGSVLALRRWLDARGGAIPTCETDRPLPPALPKRQVIDRFSQHTAHCTDCQRALHWVNVATAAAAAAGAVAAAWLATRAAAAAAAGGLTSLLSPAGALGAAAAAACWAAAAALWRLRRQFYFVDYVHAEKN